MTIYIKSKRLYVLINIALGTRKSFKASTNSVVLLITTCSNTIDQYWKRIHLDEFIILDKSVPKITIL